MDNIASDNRDNCLFSIEAALYPMLFPTGVGAKLKDYKLSEYLEYRVTQFFSPFTLYKNHLPMMYAARRTQQVLDKDCHGSRV